MTAKITTEKLTMQTITELTQLELRVTFSNYEIVLKKLRCFIFILFLNENVSLNVFKKEFFFFEIEHLNVFN